MHCIVELSGHEKISGKLKCMYVLIHFGNGVRNGQWVFLNDCHNVNLIGQLGNILVTAK